MEENKNRPSPRIRARVLNRIYPVPARARLNLSAVNQHRLLPGRGNLGSRDGSRDAVRPEDWLKTTNTPKEKRRALLGAAGTHSEGKKEMAAPSPTHLEGKK